MDENEQSEAKPVSIQRIEANRRTWRIFFRAVRTREPVLEDAAFGNNTAIACHMANESYFQEGPVTFDAASHRCVRG